MLRTHLAQIEILPSWSHFQKLNKTAVKVPVIAQRKIKDLDPFKLYSGLFDGQMGTFLLESGKGPNTSARYSIFGESNGHILKLDSKDPASFDAILSEINFDPHSPEIPYAPHFWGGWIGYFSYETVQYLEPVEFKKECPALAPDIFLVQTGSLLVYDHDQGLLKAILTVDLDNVCFETYKAAVDSLKVLWMRIDDLLEPLETPSKRSTGTPVSKDSLESKQSLSEYSENVLKAKQYIEDGDIYQANLAQQFEAPFAGNPSELYQNLKAINPSPFGGLFNLPDGALVSSSPERLVKVDKGWIETRPIAGTRPRGDSVKEDGRLSQELLLNEKERAEHLMLVDLERNDLGRLCEYGSVEVTELMNREQYSHVHHIVSNVRGKLEARIDLKKILTAVFPGGTITGCPKIRCMEIIEELEPVKRGPYCGSLGYIGYGPYLDLNILIRTIFLKEGKAIFHAGAGIVADSLPDVEYRECLSKAAALFQALSLKSP